MPGFMARSFVAINSVLKIKSPLSTQSLNYITQHSVLQIDNAIEQLNYVGNLDFYGSIDELDIK